MVVKQFQDGGRPPFLKIDVSPYLSEKSSDFDEILYTAADFELDERHVIKNENVALDRLRVRQSVFLVDIYLCNRTDRQTGRDRQTDIMLAVYATTHQNSKLHTTVALHIDYTCKISQKLFFSYSVFIYSLSISSRI